MWGLMGHCGNILASPLPHNPLRSNLLLLAVQIFKLIQQFFQTFCPVLFLQTRGEMFLFLTWKLFISEDRGAALLQTNRPT